MKNILFFPSPLLWYVKHYIFALGANHHDDDACCYHQSTGSRSEVAEASFTGIHIIVSPANKNFKSDRVVFDGFLCFFIRSIYYSKIFHAKVDIVSSIPVSFCPPCSPPWRILPRRSPKQRLLSIIINSANTDQDYAHNLPWKISRTDCRDIKIVDPPYRWKADISLPNLVFNFPEIYRQIYFHTKTIQLMNLILI